VRSIHGIKVVLTTRRNFFFLGGITGIVIDCVIEIKTHSTRKYQYRRSLPKSQFTWVYGWQHK